MKKLDALGINIYGGGFTLGVLDHFNVLQQWEEIKLGKTTFDMNFGDRNDPGTTKLPRIPRPLCDHTEWPYKEVNGVPFIYANPPCAPWSSANTHLGKTKESRFKDWRLTLTDHTYRAAIKLRPEVFISESVEGAYNIGKTHYDPYVELWMKAGYSVTFFLTDALLHGSPSRRRRFHFIAHRSKLQLGSAPQIEQPKTVYDAIWDLRSPKSYGTVPLHYPQGLNPYHAKVMPLVPPGGSMCHVVRRLHARKPDWKCPRVTFLVKRLMWDAPGATMVGFQYIHPDGKRWITFREAMRLCTYPDTFMAHSAVEAVDAVLPVVASFLAGVAKKTIMKNAYEATHFKIVDWRALGLPFQMSKVLGKYQDYDAAIPDDFNFEVKHA